MYTFVETINVGYHSSFADKGKETSVFNLQKKRKFTVIILRYYSPLRLFSVYIYCINRNAAYRLLILIHRYIDILYIYIYIDVEIYIYLYLYVSISIDIYLSIYIYIYTHKYIYIYMLFKTKNGSPGKFSIIRLPFVNRANGSLLFVRLLTKKQTEDICLKTD
jgi:hypothetical protein